MIKYLYLKNRIKQMKFEKILSDFRKCCLKNEYKVLKKKYINNYK